MIERVYASDKVKSRGVSFIQPHESYLILQAENTETYYEINKLECQIEVKRASKRTNPQTRMEKSNVDMIKWDCSCCAN